ncbi:hypothetical protein [Planctomycetes bacterium K23_9]|uniref:Uncharacterized protein n=1 Tax=Stieleria marina TaxID=1930275 RepID=A0A517P318_9BACT|nr:hypothetical protein K239x_57890 [Planctomycetes bacterium K23_9]
MKRALIAGLVGVTALWGASSPAEDRVWISPPPTTAASSRWFARPIKQLSGKIAQLDDRQLRIKVADAPDDTLIAAHRVLWIESDDLPAEAQKAYGLYNAGKFDQALRPFLDSLAEHPPVWRQQWLSMMAADAAWRAKRPTIALELVSQLDARPLPPIVLSWLPINWDNSVNDRTNETAALDKISAPSAAVRLVAASWLIQSRQRRQAVETLQKLALDNQRPIIARLAEVVSWRATLPPQVAGNVANWEQKVNALPLVLQTGPLQSLVHKYQAAGLKDEAKKLRLLLELTPVVPKRAQ